MIKLTTRDGTVFDLTDEGAVTARTDGPPGFNYSGRWIILGFLRRFNGCLANMVTLAEALGGADVGHGYVVDLDHGTHRVWMQPPGRRLRSVSYAPPALPVEGC